jgi:hypothetical protein
MLTSHITAGIAGCGLTEDHDRYRSDAPFDVSYGVTISYAMIFHWPLSLPQSRVSAAG